MMADRWIEARFQIVSVGEVTKQVALATATENVDTVTWAPKANDQNKI